MYTTCIITAVEHMPHLGVGKSDLRREHHYSTIITETRPSGHNRAREVHVRCIKSRVVSLCHY